MALVKIPQIPGYAIGLDGSELLEIVQGAVSKQCTTGLIAALSASPDIGSQGTFVMLVPLPSFPNSRGLAGETDVIEITDEGALLNLVIGIVDNGVTNAKLALMADQTVKGNISGSPASPADLTLAQIIGAIYAPIVVTAGGTYNVPNSALNVIINKTDGADVQLGTIANKVGPVKITAQNADVHPFNVTVTNGNIAGSMSTYPFNNAYQTATFYPYTAATTWML